MGKRVLDWDKKENQSIIINEITRGDKKTYFLSFQIV